VATLKYLVATVTNQYFILEVNINRLNSGNSYYQLFKKLLSSRLLPNNITVKVEITTSIILPLVLYGFKMLSLILWGGGEIRRKLTEDKVLKIYGLKKDENSRRLDET
jgi:hypothetical protein